jgi:hypothetical protein
MYVCMYLSIYIYIYVYMHMHVCVCACLCVCLSVCAYEGKQNKQDNTMLAQWIEAPIQTQTQTQTQTQRQHTAYSIHSSVLFVVPYENLTLIDQVPMLPSILQTPNHQRHVYMCMYACMYVRMCMYVRTYVCIYVCMYLLP